MKVKTIILLSIMGLSFGYYMDPTMAGYSPYLISTGGKYSQRSDGSNAVFNNPANLVFYKASGRLYSANIYDDVNIVNMSLSGKIADRLFVGMGCASLFIDNIPATSLDSIGRVQTNGNVLYKNNLYVLSAAQAGIPFGQGISIKIIDGAIDKNIATGVDFSYGAYYIISDCWITNILIDNLLSGSNPIRWSTGYSEQLPSSLTIAQSYFVGNFGFSGGLTWINLNNRVETYYNLAGTWKIFNKDNFGLEANASVYTDYANPYATFTIGTSFYYKGVMFSYALAPCAMEGKQYIHMFSLGFDL